MMLELYIGAKLIESIVIDLSQCTSYEERRARINTAATWLKYRYRATIAIKNNWEIFLIAESLLNIKTEPDDGAK